MKRTNSFLLVVMMLLLVGCGGVRVKDSSNLLAPPRITTEQPAGLVPVDIENPDLGKQQVCFFEGSTVVRLIPDAKSGGWKYSRPSFGCVEIDGANSSNNWYRYLGVSLPRNFHYVWAARQRVIDLKSLFSDRKPSLWGFPYYGSGRTGSSPDSIRYRMVVPSGGDAYVGGLIHLTRQQSSVRSVDINIEIDTRSYSAAITKELTEAVYGR